MKIEEAIQKAIQKAIDGGFNMDDIPPIDLEHLCIEDTAPLFLDKDWWQSLGKAMGWPDFHSTDWSQDTRPEYLIMWHRFIDHLAEGKSIESFFETIHE